MLLMNNLFRGDAKISVPIEIKFTKNNYEDIA
jgi:hypothetical protein